MKIQGLDLYYFDIETTGLSGLNDDFVLAVIQKEETIYTFTEIKEFFNFIKQETKGMLVGFNTENYKGGFDLPFLRSQSIRHNEFWPFAGLRHLDVFPLVQSYLNTKVYETKIPSQSSLKKPDLTELAFDNEISYTNTKDTYAKLIELHEQGKCNWNGRNELVATEYNDLQNVYINFFDTKKEENYIDVALLVDKYKKEEIDYNTFESINKEHCQNDVRRLKTITEKFLPLLPEYFIDRNIITL